MIYLNNAASSFPKPPEVFEAVANCINVPPMNHSRSGFEEDFEDIIFATRNVIGEFFGVNTPNQIIFTSGSTEALNLALRGVGLEGGHVVSTMVEHNSVIRPLKTMEQEGVLEVDFAMCDATGFVNPENIERLIKPNTKAVVLNHCSNVTGCVQDVKAISEIARSKGLLVIVDASQSAGAVPIDVKELGIDLLAFTGHKSLYGLQGSGGLFVREGIDIKPIKVGGTGVKSEMLTQPQEMPLLCEAGTPNTPGIVSLNAGINWIKKTGLDKIHDRKKELLSRIYDELAELPEVRMYRPEDKYNCWGNFCFNVGEMVPEEINYILESSYEIHVRSGLHCAPLILEPLGVHPWGTVRASVSYFTADDEVKKFIDAIKDIVKTFVRRGK
jgi:cysteine desulfurase / selenocysteine lyase